MDSAANWTFQWLLAFMASAFISYSDTMTIPKPLQYNQMYPAEVLVFAHFKRSTYHLCFQVPHRYRDLLCEHRVGLLAVVYACIRFLMYPEWDIYSWKWSYTLEMIIMNGLVSESPRLQQILLHLQPHSRVMKYRPDKEMFLTDRL